MCSTLGTLIRAATSDPEMADLLLTHVEMQLRSAIAFLEAARDLEGRL